MANLTLLLEVPDETDVAALEQFLKGHNFSLDKSSESGKFSTEKMELTKYYSIEGPGTEYDKLKADVEKMEGYRLWSNPEIQPFGFPA